MCADSRPAHHVRILVHAFFPIVADGLHGRHPVRPVTPVVNILPCTHGHFRKSLGGHFFGFLVYVGTNGRPEGVDDVKEKEHEEYVQEKLSVKGEDMGEIGVSLDEAEDGGNEAHFCGRVLLRHVFATAWSRAFLRVRVIAWASKRLSYVSVGVSSASLVDFMY